MVQQEIVRLAALRDKLDILDPQWMLYNRQIQMLVAMQNDSKVCVIKTNETNINHIILTNTWATVQYLLPLFQLARHSEVEYNYDYLQLMFKIHSRYSTYEQHATMIPVVDELKGEYTFKGISIVNYHLMLELEEKDGRHAKLVL